MKQPRNLFIFFLMGLVLGMAILALASRLHSPSGGDLDKSEIIEVLYAQQSAWNAGDIEGFMAGYLNAPELRFASGDTVERGFEPTLQRYQRRYPDPQAMGRLEFSDLEAEILAPDHALVFGRWTLFRDSDQPTGLFTLHFTRQNEAWVIASDHTSSAD